MYRLVVLRSARGTRRVWAVVLVVVALLAGVGCSAPSTASGDGPQAEDTLSTARPGYPPNGPAVGDPVAVISTPGDPAPVRYRGTAVVQACDLIPFRDPAAAGLRLVSGTAPGLLQRSYFDGQGPAPIVPDKVSLVGDDNNTCSYLFGEPGDRSGIDVHVYQPEYSGRQAIANRVEWYYRRAGAIGPVEVYERQPPFGDLVGRWLRYRGVDVELQLGPFPPVTAQAVLNAVAARLAAVAAAPTGPNSYGYRSPVFPVAFVNACTVSTAADYRAVFGTDAGPSVAEHISPGIGRIRFFDTATAPGVQANYVLHECTRHAPGPISTSDAITVAATTYDSTQAAVSALTFDRNATAVTDTPDRIGDEAVFGQWTGNGTAITFRVGNALIVLSLYQDSGPPVADVYRALLPAAVAIARRVVT